MSSGFKEYMNTRSINFTDEELSMIVDAATVTVVKKRQLLLRAGEICRYKIFVLTGLLRMYGIGADGEEHIMQFTPAMAWITDGESYNNRIPSNYNIEALEDSHVMLWTKESFEELVKAIPSLKRFSDNLITQYLNVSRNRLYKTISATPEEKYNYFLENYPGILNKVPLRMVASYIGVSLKTLSRIRQAQLQRV
ncbi:cyclic nucleotide-binding domain-containing protein [Mucilaginibacter roseus]|uniref:Cyclic nucleotide-binding domain-containing protein n=1 Tax=Mucilaginibacter roseus TaxID=1528868 RepID=A0ABS8TY17_9SPHI|nr:cyclic nucleotide-binding domain-containing protein [Mucilaginibacter roseus]MCD8739252.1 cyclic nucleotide-binding domain-containing protein [Mucilaginibacter roseus]